LGLTANRAKVRFELHTLGCPTIHALEPLIRRLRCDLSGYGENRMRAIANHSFVTSTLEVSIEAEPTTGTPR
jgi:hypothetical protein